MNVHKYARTTRHSGAELVRRVQERPGAEGRSRSPRHRHQDCEEVGRAVRGRGPCGLGRPLLAAASPEQADEGRSLRILQLRRQRWTGKQIAKETKVSAATVSRILRAARLSRMRKPIEAPQLANNPSNTDPAPS